MYDPDVRIAELPHTASVRRLKGTRTHAILTVDSEEHDLELVRAIATAVRTNPEAVETLVRYAEIRDRIDEEERTGRRNEVHRLALEDEAADALGELDRDLDVTPGEGLIAILNPGDAKRLTAALVEWEDARTATRRGPRKVVA